MEENTATMHSRISASAWPLGKCYAGAWWLIGVLRKG